MLTAHHLSQRRRVHAPAPDATCSHGEQQQQQHSTAVAAQASCDDAKSESLAAVEERRPRGSVPPNALRDDGAAGTEGRSADGGCDGGDDGGGRGGDDAAQQLARAQAQAQAQSLASEAVAQRYQLLHDGIKLKGLQDSHCTHRLGEFVKNARGGHGLRLSLAASGERKSEHRRRAARDEAKKKLRKYESKLRHASCPRKVSVYKDKIRFWTKEKAKRRRRWRGGR
eukprot:COSAG04_NODE_1370_length_7048_cov_3.294287_4_plen_226_part_00